jgi:hypothetical protein
MPAYNFKLRFRAKIESGEKRHTIRGERKQKQRVGDPCCLFTGMRTKNCRRIFNAPCLKVERIVIGANGVVIIDGEQLSRDERESFARCDGFESFSEMLAFWDGRLPFSGEVIHWDYERRHLPVHHGRAA